jgi:hypothetical protein
MKMVIAKVIFDKAFERPRTPRSAAYKKGVFDALNAISGDAKLGDPPYRVGTPEMDAWLSGVDEGKALFVDYIDSAKGHEPNPAMTASR